MAETTVTIESTLAALVEGKRYATLRDILITMNPADVAAVFEEMDESVLPLLFRLLPKELAAETFVEMEPESQELLIHGFSDAELKEVVDELYVDDAVDLVEEMPTNVVKRILRSADPEMRRMINEILRYPEDSAGSIMTTEFASLRPKMTVEEAIKRIRRTGVDKETINTCYVTDQGKLIGAISLRTLILSDPEDIIEDIMEPHVISVTTTEDQEHVAQMFSKYNFNAMPVVDTENRLVGIVTVDDAIDVLQEEVTEDIEKMAAIMPSEKTYLRSTPWDLFRHRIPWLMLLMVSATFTGMILNSFENALAAQVVLTIFIPMLMDTGGNSGSQASVTVIRARGVLRKDHADRPDADGQHRCYRRRGGGGVHHNGSDGAGGQGRRLHAAHVREKAGIRPCGNGQSLHHHHCGCAEPSRLFRHSDRSSETVDTLPGSVLPRPGREI